VFTSKGIKIIVKRGELSATGANLAFTLAALKNTDSLCLVDSLQDTVDTAVVASHAGYRVKQFAGTGAGIEGKSGSGTGGELPTIEEITELFGDKTAEVARYFALTNLEVSTQHPSAKMVERYYDFASPLALYAGLIRASKEYEKEIAQIQNALQKLDMSLVGENSILEAFEKEKFEKLKQMTPDKFMSQYTNPRIVKEDKDLVSLFNKLKTKEGDQAKEKVLRSIIKRETEGEESSLAGNYKSTFVDLAIKQGFEGEALVKRVMDYSEGKFFVSQKIHPYYEELKRAVTIIENNDVFSEDDKRILKEKIELSVTKLGFPL
jgi:hypothetical protein